MRTPSDTVTKKVEFRGNAYLVKGTMRSRWMAEGESTDVMTVDAASFIRKVMKKEFAGVRTWVRTSRTGSVDVYVDGEAAARSGKSFETVKAICCRFEAGHFDGMTDSYKFSPNSERDFNATDGTPIEATTRFVFAHATKPWDAK